MITGKPCFTARRPRHHDCLEAFHRSRNTRICTSLRVVRMLDLLKHLPKARSITLVEPRAKLLFCARNSNPSIIELRHYMHRLSSDQRLIPTVDVENSCIPHIFIRYEMFSLYVVPLSIFRRMVPNKRSYLEVKPRQHGELYNAQGYERALALRMNFSSGFCRLRSCFPAAQLHLHFTTKRIEMI